MSTQKRCTAFLITVASSALLVSCASSRGVAVGDTTHRAVVVGNAGTPSAAALYAQRFPASVMQITKGEQFRFVKCADDCSVATPKTPTVKLNAAVVRRAQTNFRTRSRAATNSETLTAINSLQAEAESPDIPNRPLRARPPKAPVGALSTEAAGDTNKETTPSVQEIVDAALAPPAEDPGRTASAMTKSMSARHAELQ